VPHAIHLRLGLQESGGHVLAPVKGEPDLGAAAAGRGVNGAHARDGSQRFFDGSRDFHLHALRRPLAGVEVHTNAREIHVRKQ
jgi:hypothetical protein